LLLVTAIIINSLMVPYQLGYEQDYTEHPLILFCLIVYIFDIPVRLRTGVSHNKISIDTRDITRSYLDKWLMLDVLAFFPFEHVFLATGDIEIARYLLLFRLLKVGRLYEVLQII
jgi:Ion transport protein